VALINSDYESDLEGAVSSMEASMKAIMGWDLAGLAGEEKRMFLSHLSFHREIVADIISEARSQLVEARREYLKRLVAYHKDFAKWFSRLERQFAA